jgi:hypothetical protein
VNSAAAIAARQNATVSGGAPSAMATRDMTPSSPQQSTASRMAMVPYRMVAGVWFVIARNLAAIAGPPHVEPYPFIRSR